MNNLTLIFLLSLLLVSLNISCLVRAQLSYNIIEILKYSIGQSPNYIVQDNESWEVAKIKTHNFPILGEFVHWNPKEAVKLRIEFNIWLMIEINYKGKNLHFRFYN